MNITNRHRAFNLCPSGLFSLICLLLLSSPQRIVQAQTAETSSRIKVNAERAGFVDASGKPFYIWGVNYDHDESGRLLEDYWEQEWQTVEQDFQEIKSLGANVVRIHLQLGKFMDSASAANDYALSHLDKLLKLAESTGLRLDITGLGCYHKRDVPLWYDRLSESDRWDVQRRFWVAVASRCKSSPAVFCYDLMNEPILPGSKTESDWLAGEFAGKHFVQRIALDLNGRTREQVASSWVKHLATAIREVDPQGLITVGVIPWAMTFPGAKPIFYSPRVSGPLDFVSVHVYPKRGEVNQALAALRDHEIGKPLVVEEFFPLNCSPEEAEEFIDRSRASGFISFYWGHTIQQYEQSSDIKGAILANWLKTFQKRAMELNSKP